MSSRVIRSVGIDIGTTTTQVIFSRLELINRAPASQVPHYEFAGREITYAGPSVFTPFDDDGGVSRKELETFIRSQYAAAFLTLEEVESGAIIITGETSKASNARSTIMELAQLLGDFVVAAAGPHLESIIAGHGSGAGEHSKKNACRTLNIDIGGGTSNYVVFEAGRVVDTACLNVGGHLVETFGDGRVKKVREPALRICEAQFGKGVDPTRFGRRELDMLSATMAGLIVEVLQGKPSKLAQSLLMTDCLRPGWRFDQIFFSGGVGECYYHPESSDSPFVYGDIGPLLAEALRKREEPAPATTQKPRQTLRATVIGAGAHTLSLSGSTIWLNAKHLPLRNVPVLQPGLEWKGAAPGRLAESWLVAAKRMDLDPAADLYALALPDDVPVAYKEVLAVSGALRQFHEEHPNARHPLIVIARQDLGKALGMELQPQLAGRELAVIDEVKTRDGDYVDIGKPFFGGQIVPLTVKSLAFPS
ncbi:MAG: ethanolamine ammonia-lyase reactivating factor EutA [Deltaproteobacteria bacterium]|jgi:ethanolamine utilization protein EutA|nr:ethanolamine ammonia-lyase reactivating factor EutA [Deltaproteobacteria bacterium]